MNHICLFCQQPLEKSEISIFYATANCYRCTNCPKPVEYQFNQDTWIQVYRIRIEIKEKSFVWCFYPAGEDRTISAIYQSPSLKKVAHLNYTMKVTPQNIEEKLKLILTFS